MKKASFYHATFLSFLEFLPPSQIANKRLAGWLDGRSGDHEWWPCDASVRGSTYWCVRTMFRDTACRIESRLVPNLVGMEALCTLLWAELPPWPSRIRHWGHEWASVDMSKCRMSCLCPCTGFAYVQKLATAVVFPLEVSHLAHHSQRCPCPRVTCCPLNEPAMG